jgi:hypothetical protein
MYVLLVALAALGSLLPVGNLLAQTEPPSIEAVLVEDFAPLTQTWQPATGRWSVSNGFYTSTFTGETDISTITTYPGINPGDTSDTQLRLSDYILRARMFNRGGTSETEVGFVFGYQDPQNYNELVADGGNQVRLRTVVNGAVTREVSVASSERPDLWFDFEFRYRNGAITVKINGRDGQAEVQVPDFPMGQVGLITHGAVGRFDKVFLGVPKGEQNFYEDFTSPPFVTFEPQSGDWPTPVRGGRYSNIAVQQTAISLAPVRSIGTGPDQISDYGFAARMVNPFKGPGNLIGLVFNYTTNGYYEVVFSPTGVARLNRFASGRLTTLATASYNGGQNVPFSVALEFSPSRNAVIVDGQPLFVNVVTPDQTAAGRIGFITHWSQASFDNVQFHRNTAQQCSFGFSSPPPAHWIVSGSWNTTGGTLNSATYGAKNIVDLKCAVNSTNDESANDFVLRARVLNPHPGPGNRVGLIVNYQDPNSLYAGDYYEFAFTGTGVMEVHKVINGVDRLFGSVQLSLPRNTFFDVEIHRAGIWGRVKVNGTEVFPSLFLGALNGGSVGVITHFAQGGRFDNVTLSAGGTRPDF